RPSGGFAIVRPGSQAGRDTAPRPGTTMPLAALRALDVPIQGAGGHTVTLTFAAPPADHGDTGRLEVVAGHSPLPAGQRSRSSATRPGSGSSSPTRAPRC